MNKFRIITVLLALTMLATSCGVTDKDHGFNEFYNKYKDEDNFTSLSLKPGLMRLFMGSDDQEAKDMMKHLKQFKMLVYDNDAKMASRYTRELNELIERNHYEDLLVVNSGGENVTFKARMNEGKIVEVIMIATEEGSLTILYLKGAIEMKDVKAIAGSVSKKKDKEQ